MRIVAISDTHGKHRELDIPDGDILIHAGDITSAGSYNELAEINDFFGALPHKHKIIIAGNHDSCFEASAKYSSLILSNVTYLQDEMVTIEGVNIYGSPWQPEFNDWSFNLKRGSEIKAKWDFIPDNTDILITHGPPFTINDATPADKMVGCSDLLNAVKRVKPKYHIFGHIHHSFGIHEEDEIKFINACSVNEAYQIVNPPIVFDY